MDTTYRIKTKVGPHEFEAEGPVEAVQAQFKAWKEMIASVPVQFTPQPQIEARQADFQPPAPPSKPDMASIDSFLNKIMKVDDHVISLTVRPKSADDAVLLILYGQKVQRGNDSVTGAQVMSGLTSTGGLAVGRVDRMLEKAGTDGDVIVTGEHRAKRYRLTNSGLQKARQIASDLLAI